MESLSFKRVIIMGESKRRKQADPNYGKSKTKSSISSTDLIQPKKGTGKLTIGEREFDSEWAALGIANIESSVANQKGFLLVKTSSETYAFVGNKPFQKIVNGSLVTPATLGNTGWQWKLSVVKMIIISENNESFDFDGGVFCTNPRKEGISIFIAQS
jgi:hypothetical protein